MSPLTTLGCFLLVAVITAQDQREISLTVEDFARAEERAAEIEEATRTGTVDPLGSNDLSNDSFVEGDMLNLKRPKECDESDPFKICNGIRDTRKRWPGGQVPYTISSSFSSNDRATIAAAVREFNSRAGCVNWIPRSSQRDYVSIIVDGGCYSMVGRIGGRQSLSLGRGCVTKGITMHEMMHAAGFYHEQSRNDRDSYIIIRTENMIPGTSGQFTKYGLNHITHLGTSYDYGSIMHYGRYAFSRNRQPTIETRRSGVEIGQRRQLSATDIQKLNLMYGCGGSVVGPQTRPPPTRVTFPPVTRPPTRPPTRRPPTSCTDTKSQCSSFASRGYCRGRNSVSRYMARNCCRSCQTFRT